jgi:hypothetical protein
LAKINAAVQAANVAEDAVASAKEAPVSRSTELGLLLLEAKKLHPVVKGFEALPAAVLVPGGRARFRRTANCRFQGRLAPSCENGRDARRVPVVAIALPGRSNKSHVLKNERPGANAQPS